MKIRNEICDLIDRGKKGYITLGDVGVATFYIGLLISIIYLVYCGLPVWKLYINGEYTSLSYFSVLEQVGFFVSLTCITLSIFVMIIFIAFMIDTLSEKVVIKCRRKEK